MKLPLRKKIWAVFGLAFFLLLILLAHPVFHLTKTWWNDRNELASVPAGKANDASRLDETAIAETWTNSGDFAAGEKQLAELLQRACANHLKVSIAGARHSMGGHTIYPGGIVIDMQPFNRMELRTGNILRVGAGARWRDIIIFLNTNGLSVEVMQSNDDFSVGGSISVNCHGWQFNRPPIDATVESLRLMLADGRIVTCNRTENAELFSLVLGGYGLFGIILEADLHVVPNECYRLETLPVASSNYVSLFASRTADEPGVGMVYGRLRMTATNFLSDALLNIYWRKTPPTNFLVSKLPSPATPTFKRTVFRSGVGSDYGKWLRWEAESLVDAKIIKPLFGREHDRNQILFVPADWFLEHGSNRTDILIECFVPPPKFEKFLVDLRKIIPANHADLLNLTVRHVNADTDSFLHYADRDMVALVMLFNHTCDAAGEAGMAKVTQEIVAAALLHEGRYYLPYRLHATPEQFNAAYPQAKKFFELKHKYDPDELFQNEFYLKYGK